MWGHDTPTSGARHTPKPNLGINLGFNLRNNLGANVRTNFETYLNPELKTNLTPKTIPKPGKFTNITPYSLYFIVTDQF